MKIGSLGKIIFTVSDSTIMTLRDLMVKHNASISVHKVHLGTGLTEYTGSEPLQITFKIRMSAFLGASPQKEIAKLDDYVRKGTTLTFVLGDKTYGKYRWLVDSYSVAAEYYDKAGNVTQADISVSLREYLKG